MEYDFIDGQKVPPTEITSDTHLVGVHRGTVKVLAGELILSGTLQGTLSVSRGASVLISGKQHGTVALGSGSNIVVTGSIHGTTVLEPNSNLIIEEGGKLAGTLQNDGVVIIRGAFGGARSGMGRFQVEGNGYIKEPVIKNGAHYYEW